MTHLAGKAVVITGAGRGLGAAYARHIAELGASVVVNDVDAAMAQAVVSQIIARGGAAVACPGDVSAWSCADMLIDSCCDTFGAIDGVVNNAGILRPALMADVQEADLRRMFEINVLGVAACARAAALRMTQTRRGGSILNVASGSQAGDIALGGYGATKAAVASLTFSWAMELRGSNVRMNAISPLAETAMAKQNAHLMAAQSAHREVRYASLPEPEINAPLVAYLLSDASSDVNGQIVRIAGRQLSFVTHPMIAAPVLESDWTFEKIADAFATTLSAGQQRLGLAYAASPADDGARRPDGRRS